MRAAAVVSIVSLLSLSLSTQSAIADQTLLVEPMQGVPPMRESQVTMQNFRDYPMSKWAFQNSGAPLNVVMIPRQGNIVELPGPSQPQLGEKLFTTAVGDKRALINSLKATMRMAW